ncbi:hypothetical protein CRUP_026738 [Coryphaenoides rupestris]|nr:hypothetical protein CRUP_026738 [Coryphaenoides rupestris]
MPPQLQELTSPERRGGCGFLSPSLLPVNGDGESVTGESVTAAPVTDISRTCPGDGDLELGKHRERTPAAAWLRRYRERRTRNSWPAGALLQYHPAPGRRRGRCSRTLPLPSSVFFDQE